jgi:porin
MVVSKQRLNRRLVSSTAVAMATWLVPIAAKVQRRKHRHAIGLFILLACGAVICAGQLANAQSQPAPTGAGNPPSGPSPAISLGQSLSQPAPTGVSNLPSDPRAAMSLGQVFENWLTQPTMTGDWGGLRTKLSQEGFDFHASYTGEYAYNFSGGKRIGGDYAQELTWGVDADMGTVAGLTGGAFHLEFNQRQGRSTTADFIGNRLAVQTIFGGGENLRITELNYEQNLFDDTLILKAGYLVMGNDFAATRLLCLFENVAFCAHPQSLPNDSGWTDFPNSRWGGEAIVNLPHGIYAETAIVDVNPTYALHQNGLKFSLQGSTGALFAQEFGKTVQLGPAAMPGHYKTGGYYDTSSVPGIANPQLTYSGRYGGYIVADQMVWSFERGTNRGLIVVGNATLNDRRTSQIGPYFTAALVAQGPFAARPHDSIAIGYVRDFVNHNLIQRKTTELAAEGALNPDLALGENIVEIAYALQVTPWMAIHPNVQYIGNPGAFTFTHIPNAWVFGLHVGLVL